MDIDQLYMHIRVVLGILLGLAITKLLTGITSIVEHPRRYKWSWIHMGWVTWALLSIVTFWWWEFRLVEVKSWTFESYLFIIVYGSLYFVLTALLFPSDVDEYRSYEGYLLHRRPWFFGLIAMITVMDLVDTVLKGVSRWHALGAAYPIHAVLMLGIAAIGISSESRQTQIALAAAALAYQIAYFIFEYFTVLAT
ncbi:hypothetical protein LZK98_14020 [Sphingomonas cannabina]|uniref:hypothetical protein n=1 Tax=Sphingomonas cannabina TaxID=2899123 RepID=UPI001F3A39D5|nr:hypothetical protein [Sphingomonas cannabina]UIJ44187.1 hypothetical protein LZK98_14020 [Sphingomonas cannabina]